MPTALALLADGFEEIEFVTPVDLLRRAGVTVVSAAIGPGIHVTGRSGLTLHADTNFADLGEREFDCLILPGGPGVKVLRADTRVAALVRRQAATGRWIAAICAAPLVLKDLGLLEGKNFTSHASTEWELTDRQGLKLVVIDGSLITSRGAGTALEFGLELVRALTTPEKAKEVATSICR